MCDYKDFMILRAVVGIFEGGLFPGIVLYLSSMYTCGELAVRIGVFYTGGSLSGAFGGLLARGRSAIGPRGRLEGWRWIFIMEGVITAIVAVAYYIGLPNSRQEAPFLTKEEQQWAVGRCRALEPQEPFQWSEVLRGIFNVQVWLNSTSYFAIISGLYSFGLFRHASPCHGLMALGMYCAVPPVLVWNANNSAGHYKRATTSGLQLAVANAGGFVASIKSTVPLSSLLMCCRVLANVFWCARINHDKAQGKYNECIGSGDGRDSKFKMVL
ncbi:hypothetical protein MY11210_006719 [Beauveria gryllotalpidicola]